MNFFGKSDTGKVRSANQDSYLIRAITRNATLAVVCDGMGGAKSGNVASECAVEVFCERVVKYASGKIHDGHLRLTSDDACIILDNAVHDANTAVWRKSQSSPDFQGMGTTLVAALFVDDVVYVVNVGDSRLYLISDNTITQITHDHSYVQYLVDIGRISEEEARTAPNRNIITKAVGTESSVDADVFVTEIDPTVNPAYVLLCSDGLTNYLAPEQLFEILKAETSVDEKTTTLISRANSLGGTDNITAVVIVMES